MFLFLTAILNLLILNSGNLEINNAWIRPNTKGTNTALFFEIKNNSDKVDALIGVSADASKKVEMHETYEHDGMMGMRKVDEVTVGAKSTAVFKPGAQHVMFIILKRDLKKGDKVDVTFTFKSGAKITQSVVVKEMMK